MADLEFSGGFDISEALQQVDSLGEAIQSRIDDALGNISVESFVNTLATAAADALSAPIPVEADASAIPAQVEAALAETPSTVPVDADTTPAVAAVSDLVGAVEADSPSITVDADTTEAQSALDELDSSARDAGTSLSGASGGAHEFGLSAGQLAGAAGLAVGEVGGLREASSLLGERTAAATAGVLGLGVGIGELYHAGLNAVSAEERFTKALGDQAEAVQRVQVGSLDADLLHLGATFGSADAAMQNATASVFQFAVNSGASRTEARNFADGIAAISARAVATKPSVGNLSDVMDRAAIGIGRARTAASLLNIGLSTLEVNSRAAQIAQQKGEESATAYDKSLAALQITVEKFGPSLKANIEDGSRNAANQAKAAKAEFDNALESFGKPLVAPGLELIKSSIPVAEDLGKALAEVATVAIPALTTALDVLGPAIEPVLIGFLAMKAFTLGAALYNSLLLLAGGWGLLGDEAATAAAEVKAASVEMAESEAVATSGLSLIVGAAVAGVVALGGFGDAAGSVAEQTHKMSDELAKLDGAQLVKKFEAGATIRALADNTSLATAKLREFRSIAEDNVGTAQRLLHSLAENGEGSSKYVDILNNQVDAQKRKNAAEKDSQTTSDQLLANTQAQNDLNTAAFTSLNNYATGTGTATQALKDLTSAQQNENDEITLYKNNLLALQGVQGDVTAATIAFNNAGQRTLDTLTKNGAAFDLNTQAGRDNVAALQSQVSAADGLAEATYKSELATRGETQARSDADAVLSNFKTSLDQTLYSLGLSTAQVEELDRQLGLLHDPPPINVDVKINEQVIAAGLPDVAGMQAFIDSQSGLAGLQPLVDFFNSLGQRAAGGPVAAGEPYLVNEDTPRSEIFVPSVSGTIYPANTAWTSGPSDSGGGDTFHFDKVVLEQATPNPTRETVSAAQQLRHGAALAGLG